MIQQIKGLHRVGTKTARDVTPVILVIAVFQILVIGEPLPDLGERLLGLFFVLVGLTFFVRGLAMSVFPLGDGLADALAKRGSVWLLVAFSFAVGFGSTVAEPALAAVTDEAASAAAASGMIEETDGSVRRYALSLRYAAATAVGLAVVIGVIRTLKGWPIAYFVLGGYGLATLLIALGAPAPGIALDAGTAATSAINIPLIIALGSGLAAVLRRRSALIDGFGIVALASVMPMLTILAGGLLLRGTP